MLKLGINSGNIIRTFGIDEGFRQIAKSGFDSVDLDLCYLRPITWPYDGAHNQPYTQWEMMTDEELLESMRPYRDASEKYGVAIAQAHAVDPPFINEPSMDARLLEVIKRTIMICGYLGCPYLIIHPAHCEYPVNNMTPEDEWKANMHMFGELIPWLKKYNVIACLENMYIVHRGKAYASTCQVAAEANRYIDTLNEMAGEKRFAFCLDTGHALMVGMQLDNVIRELGHRLETLHINDNDGQNDSHMMPLTGEMHWEKVIKGLKEIGYRNTLNFELQMKFEKAVLPAAMDFVAAVGRSFSDKIEGKV